MVRPRLVEEGGVPIGKTKSNSDTPSPSAGAQQSASSLLQAASQNVSVSAPASIESSALSKPSSIESRLRALESQFGVQDEDESTDSQAQDLFDRLQVLEEKQKSVADSSLRQTWAESDKLLQELDPGMALTHQQLIAAPILYRKQHVLAAADSLQVNLKQVADILHLLLIGQPPVTDRFMIKEEFVTQAPILTERPAISDQDRHRMDAVQQHLMDLQGRTVSVADTLDRLLDNYHTLMSAVSEKIVLADEELRHRQQR